MNRNEQYIHVRFTLSLLNFTAGEVVRQDDRAILRALCGMALLMCQNALRKNSEEKDHNFDDNALFLKRRIRHLLRAQTSLQHVDYQPHDGTIAYDFYTYAPQPLRDGGDMEYRAKHLMFHTVFESISNMADVMYSPRGVASMYEDGVFDPAREYMAKFLKERFGTNVPAQIIWRDIREACDRLIQGNDNWNRMSVEFTTKHRAVEPDPFEAKKQNERHDTTKILAEFFKQLREKRNG